MTQRVKLPLFVGAGLAVALLLAFLVSPRASSRPDGLEKVAIDNGFADTAQGHDLDYSPLTDYGVKGVDDPRLSTGVAGVVGVATTFALGLGLFALVRRKSRATPTSTST